MNQTKISKIFFSKNELSKLEAEIANFDGKIIVITGPTASGKSATALQMAKLFNGAVINTDSRQIYKELSIGVASPQPDKIIQVKDLPGSIWEIEGVRHYLYGYRSITDQYNVVDFRKDLELTIEKISSQYDKLFLVGGSGLFVDMFVNNYTLESVEADQKYNRDDLNLLSIEDLEKLLSSEALALLNESDRKNKYRLIRHIERSGQKYSKGEPINHLYAIINISMEELEKDIRKRTAEMFKKGLLKENDELRELETLLGHETLIHKVISYKEFDSYYSGEKNLEQIAEEINLRNRQYAKRQKTWFKKLQH